MKITIFTELTTNEHLDELKAESEKYTGLYVDMNNKEERKYVKDKADDINQLLKKVERLRIDATSDYKKIVESEAANIKERLESANEPFTLLIDEHKAERKKILDAEKADKEARELLIKIEDDHEVALLMNNKFDQDKKDALAAKEEYERKLKEEAAAQAVANEKAAAKANEERIEREKQEAIERESKAIQDKKDAEIAAKKAKEQQLLAEKQAIEDAAAAKAYAAEQLKIAEHNAKQQQIQKQKAEQEATELAEKQRESNKKHLAKVHRGILEVLISNGISESDSKLMVTLAAKKRLPNLSINY